jgi:hypothetical protein
MKRGFIGEFILDFNPFHLIPYLSQIFNQKGVNNYEI